MNFAFLWKNKKEIRVQLEMNFAKNSVKVLLRDLIVENIKSMTLLKNAWIKENK